jgi:hypothetical protein
MAPVLVSVLARILELPASQALYRGQTTCPHIPSFCTFHFNPLSQMFALDAIPPCLSFLNSASSSSSATSPSTSSLQSSNQEAQSRGIHPQYQYLDPSAASSPSSSTLRHPQASAQPQSIASPFAPPSSSSSSSSAPRTSPRSRNLSPPSTMVAPTAPPSRLAFNTQIPVNSVLASLCYHILNVLANLFGHRRSLKEVIAQNKLATIIELLMPSLRAKNTARARKIETRRVRCT